MKKGFYDAYVDAKYIKELRVKKGRMKNFNVDEYMKYR